MVTFRPTVIHPALEAVEPTEVAIAGLLLATGFVMGALSVEWVRTRMVERVTDSHARSFRLSEEFAAGYAHEKWDPAGIHSAPNVSDLATEEERVLRLLVANGGRMRQATLISATDWSEAKVSRVLQRMEQHGDLSRIHVGRNNLILLGAFREEAEQGAGVSRPTAGR